MPRKKSGMQAAGEGLLKERSDGRWEIETPLPVSQCRMGAFSGINMS